MFATHAYISLKLRYWPWSIKRGRQGRGEVNTNDSTVTGFQFLPPVRVSSIPSYWANYPWKILEEDRGRFITEGGSSGSWREVGGISLLAGERSSVRPPPKGSPEVRVLLIGFLLSVFCGVGCLLWDSGRVGVLLDFARSIVFCWIPMQASSEPQISFRWCLCLPAYCGMSAHSIGPRFLTVWLIYCVKQIVEVRSSDRSSLFRSLLFFFPPWLAMVVGSVGL